VFPGFGGQSYIESVSDNIVLFAQKIKESGRDILLELDGGVTEQNAERFRSLGITVLVAGSATFKAADPEKAIAVMRG
ncbi:MAG TPA: ribulose-phosphate 3-epimerase, partial [Clostridiales bacterium]|nr:ribulose-phosphate 3-epimerase [Clostridiales bacterium]